MITQIFILKDPPVIASDQIRSVTPLCPALCDPMNRSTAAIKWNLLKQGETVQFYKSLSPATEGSSVAGCMPQGLQDLTSFPLSHPSLLFIKEA